MIGDLPRHLYVYVDTVFTHAQPQTPRFVPAVWFGLTSTYGRAWGCSVLLESGAIYRNLPPHALAFTADPEAAIWPIEEAQTWDCYGPDFKALEYRYLSGLSVMARTKGGQVLPGVYLFTVAPMGDGFTANPEQAKEFSFVQLDNGRLTVQPTNHLVFREASFTTGDGSFPKGLKRQTEIYSTEP